MEAKELRIGNYIYLFGRPVKIHPLNIVGLSQLEAAGKRADEMEPIPLTPEILEKAGFETNENKVEYVIGLPIGFGSDLFIENEDHESMGCGIKDYQGGFHYFKDIRYLHQLQNLFFAICGEELKIEL